MHACEYLHAHTQTHTHTSLCFSHTYTCTHTHTHTHTHTLTHTQGIYCHCTEVSVAFFSVCYEECQSWLIISYSQCACGLSSYLLFVQNMFVWNLLTLCWNSADGILDMLGVFIFVLCLLFLFVLCLWIEFFFKVFVINCGVSR